MRIKALIILLCLLSIATRGFGATFSTTVLNGSQKNILPEYPVKVTVSERNKGSYQQIYSESNGRSGSNGIFTGEIDAPVGKILTAEINYRGITYLSKPQVIKGNRPHYDLDVEVYEITSSHADISIPSRTIIVTQVDDKTLEIYDSLQVINSGNTTYVGTFNDELDLSQVLHIPVPESYRLREIQTGADSSKTRTLGRAIVLQKEIKPGESQFSMRYLVLSDIGFFDLSLFSEKDTPEVEELFLYFPDSNKWKIKPSTLVQAGEKTFGSTNYRMWRGKPGSVLRLKAYSPAYTGGFNFWHIALILAFLLTGICLLLARKKISHWHLIQEGKKLTKLQAIISRETADKELADYYQPFNLILNSRIQKAKHFAKGK